MKKSVFALAAVLVLAFTIMAGCADNDAGDLGERPIAEISIDNVELSNGTYYSSKNVEVEFNASNSLDVDGVIKTYQWNFDDGSVGYSKKLTHLFLDEGVYTVMLTVKDDKGNLDSDAVTVRISGTAGYGVSMQVATKSHVTSPGRDTDFAVTLKNTGNTKDSFQLKVGAMPSGFTFSAEFASVELLPGETTLLRGTIRVPSTASKIKSTIELIAQSMTDDEAMASEDVEVDVKIAGVGPAVEGDLVKCQYIGWYEDGEVFDSSLEAFSEGRGDEPLLVSLGTSSTSGYTSVITGFKNGLLGMRVGETNVVRLTSEEGYNDGQVRIFEIKLVSIDS